MAMPHRKYYYKGHEYYTSDLVKFAKEDFDVDITEKQLKCRLAKIDWNVYKSLSTPIKQKQKRILYFNGKETTIKELKKIAKEKYNNDISIQLLYNRIVKQNYDILDAIKRGTFDDNYKQNSNTETLHEKLMRTNKNKNKETIQDLIE